jgi:aspartyl-tRNA(Asn)/glutamyl-tRNA(Gln) amidotransferase subunit A
VHDEPDFTSAATLAEAIKRGDCSPVELCLETLARIEQLDPALHAFRLVDADRALGAARAAEQALRRGDRVSPLHGIPYATKDLFDVAGVATTAGSHARAQAIADADAEVTRRLADAGLVLVGKTHTVEFAFGSVGINHSHGTPRNPWQAEPHVPGGSSSGSAVAVAAGLVPLATGTDTACSVRTPAALCGVVGLKTTVGRVSRTGIHPLSTTLDSVGPITRTVRDAALLFDLLQGPDPRDPTTQGVAPIDVLSALDAGVKGARIGIAEGLLFEEIDAEVEHAVRDAASVFRELGARAESTHFAPAATALARPNVISLVEGYAANRTLLETVPEQLDPFILERLRSALEVRAVDYRAALAALPALRDDAARHFERYDVLLAPTCALPARPVSTIDQDFTIHMTFADRYRRNCLVGNLLDLCGISVPCGFTRDGLPIGLMIYGARFREDLILRVAQAYESATRWSLKRPPAIKQRTSAQQSGAP